MALVVVVLAGVEAIPAAFGHDQSALSAELAASDAATAVTKIDPFEHAGSAQSCANLEAMFGVGNHLLKNRQFGFYASIWPSYQALNAMYVASLLPGEPACQRDFRQLLVAVDDNYWEPSNQHVSGAFDQGPRAFHFTSDLPRVDDSLWMGLAIMQQYSMTRDPALLVRAEDVFNLAVSNWAPNGGGVYWEATGAHNQARTVVSNAPAAILGVELFVRTSDDRFLKWSEKIVNWLNANLRDPATGLYDDNIDSEGRQNRVDTTKYTYTQGMMVGAMTALAAVAPTQYPLSDAVSLSERAITYFDGHRAYGQPGFDVIWAESILRTAGVSNNYALTAEARSAVEQALATEPKGQGDLLTVSSETALRDLAELAPTKYADLIYVLPPMG